jgi:hypothetical protein
VTGKPQVIEHAWLDIPVKFLPVPDMDDYRVYRDLDCFQEVRQAPVSVTGMEKPALCVSPGNLGNVLRQQLLKTLLLLSILKYSLRNHRELT